MVEENTNTNNRQDQNADANVDANTNINADANVAGGKDNTLIGDAGKAAASKAPETYDFKVEEGMELDTGLIEKVTPVLKKLDLTQENAQELVDVYAPYVKEQVVANEQKAVESWNKQVDDWKAETVKILGVGAKEDMAAVGRILNAAGSPELRTLLNESGYGNHPEFVKFFVKVGKAISEDTFVEGKGGLKEVPGPDFDKMYPTMVKK